MSQRSVILVGMMGAGKTEVGRELASQLGYKFVDTDKEIEKRAGKKILKIFEDDGEPHFRALEREAIAELRERKGLVISIGGGAFLDDESRAHLAATGLTIYLKASPRELYARIKNDTTGRPLLTGPEPRREIERLLQEREFFYEQCAVTIDTEEIQVEEVVDRIIDEMAKRTVGD